MAREDIARNSLTSAERILEQAILLDNSQADAFYQLGYVYSRRGKFKKAIAAFQKTLALDAFYTEAAIALSSLYNDVGRYRDGAQVFQKTKQRLDKVSAGHDPRINRTLAKHHHELGLFYLRFERHSEAHHEFAKALNLEPENAGHAVQMAKCLSRMGDKAGAITFLRKTVEGQPSSVEARIQLGVLYHSQQLLRDAHREWQEALSMEPDNKAARMYLSMLDFEPPEHQR